MKVAIVHDWLVAPGGAEKVLEQMIECFPDADLFSLVDFLEDRRPLHGKPVTTSFIQHLPLARRRYRAYLPLMPLAVEQFDLAGYDLIIEPQPAPLAQQRYLERYRVLAEATGVAGGAAAFGTE